ncbi:MAG: CotH kinase family protein [Myxococcota bacterium]|nr:CotH kinase family protein [Myxococcota bacterium]
MWAYCRGRSLLPLTTVCLLCACDSGDTDPFSLNSNLPLVWIDTNGVDVDSDEFWDEDDSRAWVPATATFIEPDGEGLASLDDAPAWSGQAGLHVRGSSSAEEYDKKSYALETWGDGGADLDVSLLGLPSDEDWILHGPFSDKTLMRNHLMYTWSRDVGRYAARTVFVELWLDDGDDGLDMEGDYRGVYLLMEKVKRDADRVDIVELDPPDETEPDISGGYLLKKDWVDEERPETFLVTDRYEDVILFVDPDPDAITDAQRDWITGYLDEFETALAGPDFGDPSAGYAPFIDVDSFIDHHLLVELGRNVDGYVLSTFLHKDREGPLTMGPIWDYNGALGNADYFEAWETEGWHFDYPGFPENNPTAYEWYWRLFEDPDFRARYAERWFELREGPLATEALLGEVDRVAALLDQGAVERNFARWDVLGEYVWPNDEGFEDRESYSEEIGYLKGWIEDRSGWMDEAIADEYLERR